MSTIGDRLAVAFVALGRIGARLRASLERDAAAFPVTPSTVRRVDADAATARDAFLQRFQQTSDHLLRKLLPRSLAAIDGSAEFRPMRDMLDALERAGAIDSPDPWLTLIELRNRLIHEYALSDQELAADLNDAWVMAPWLLDQIARMRDYALAHNLLDGALIDED